MEFFDTLQSPVSSETGDFCGEQPQAAVRYVQTVGATLGRPRILPVQNPSPPGETYGYSPSENPKNHVFRLASEARPYSRGIGSAHKIRTVGDTVPDVPPPRAAVRYIQTVGAIIDRPFSFDDREKNAAVSRETAAFLPDSYYF